MALLSCTIPTPLGDMLAVASAQGLCLLEFVGQGGVEREYLLLEFARGERLYVPVDQSHRVTVYSSGGLSPALSTLGSGEWVKTKRRVRRAALSSAAAPSSLPDHAGSAHVASAPPHAQHRHQGGTQRRGPSSTAPRSTWTC